MRMSVQSNPKEDIENSFRRYIPLEIIFPFQWKFQSKILQCRGLPELLKTPPVPLTGKE